MAMHTLFRNVKEPEIMTFRAIAFSAFCSSIFLSSVAAAPLSGVYNTGRSEVEGAEDSSLDIEFHACKHDEALSCGTILRVVNPGPDATDTMPDGSPIVGFTMITDLEDRGKGKYRDGKINAVDESIEDGEMRWYGLKVTDQFDGTLEAKGCVGPFCARKMIWTRIEASAEATAAEAEALAPENTQAEQ